MKIQSVAVIDMGGFLAESAPVIKDGRGKDKRTFILLTFEQRERIGKWFISRDDYQWLEEKIEHGLKEDKEKQVNS